jgi:hypothetical protein
MSIKQITLPTVDPVGEISRPVEIVIHVSDRLSQAQRQGLVEALTRGDDVCSAEFCQLRDHLMLVRYDRDKINSLGVLNKIEQQRYRAQLVGPI